MEAMTRDKWESKILLEAIYNIIKALRNPAHARYVSAEKDAALAWYSGSGGLSGGILELPGRPDGFSPAKPCYLMQETFLDKYKPQCHFPYITSLLLEHLYRIDETMGNWAPVPLDRTYPGNNPQFGAAIIDITDMGNITYETVYVLMYPGATDGAEAQLAFMRALFASNISAPLQRKFASGVLYGERFAKTRLLKELKPPAAVFPVSTMVFRRHDLGSGYTLYRFALDRMLLGPETLVARLLYTLPQIKTTFRITGSLRGPDSLGADEAKGRLRPHLLVVDSEVQLYRDNLRAVLGDRWTLLAKNEINSFQCIFVRGRGRTGLQFAMVNQFLALEAPDADRSQLAPKMKELCLEDLNVKERNNVLKEFSIED
ncbi:hypothetical protein LEL_07126 [Akanthomyces lecanii RCEF 1005]|uniref:Uncharacterized protein n=1 Tax=Akanthomyces lecanii RCEF 1005 TaxID=1081108 RepID=A0A162KHW3_CORDF|nr:hypothetical protein LEL_07126 [Akanthomyces lecanii RCEF 1005]